MNGDANEIAEIIQRQINAAVERLQTRTYKRGIVASVSGQSASVYIEGNTVATAGIPAIYSYTPTVGHKVLIVSIGTTGANLCIIGRLP